MSTKRALVVDDSRSARVILSRMLEASGLQVDTAESGEQALDYLRTTQPDVVFMDHLMPGMDGFDAVRAIKSNRQTAAIPVMMYTSQEGEPYLQQARKAGAAGVLSKTLRPSDVSRALYELQLLPDRREPRDLEIERAAPFANEVAQEGRDSAAQLRDLLQSNFESMGDRLRGELRATAHHVAATQPQAPPQRAGRGAFAWALLAIALIPSITLGVLYWRTLNDNRAQLQEANARLGMVVTEQQTQIDQLRAELRRMQGDSLRPTTAEIEIAPVPYGESPFARDRVQRLQAVLARLRSQHARGVLRVVSYVGDFCLSGTVAAGYRLAEGATPLRNCDLVGNPFEDALTQATRQSAEFQSASAGGGDAIRVELTVAGRKSMTAYPAQADNPAARDWNRAAQRNNRVEYVFIEGATE